MAAAPRSIAIVAFVGVLAVAAASCSTSDSTAAPRATTTTAPGKVSVDLNTKSPSVKYTDPKGNVTSYGPGASLPQGWPTALTPPKSITIVSSSSSESGGKKQLYVTGEATQSLDQVYAAVKQQLTGAGFKIGTDLRSEASDFVSVQAKSDAFDADVSVSSDPDTRKVTVLYTLTAAS